MGSLSTQLHLRQTQKLVMTPMLQQALKILQMNSLELTDLIQQEISENPMLEEVEKEEETPTQEETEASAEALDATPVDAVNEAGEEIPEVAEPPEASMEGAEDAKPVEVEDPALPKDNWEDYFDDNGTDYKGTQERPDEDKDGFETFLSAPAPSLQEHLLRQMEAQELPQSRRVLVEELIGRVNERGYLEGDLKEIAAQLGRAESELFEALRLIQGMDPTGVGARNLRECLLLQLEVRGQKDSLAWKVVSGHLEDLERRRFDPICRELKASLAEVKQAEILISNLEPMPGRPFGGEPNPAVIVDAFVERDENGKWQVYLNDKYLPRLGFNSYYRKMLKNPAAKAAADNAEAKAWLKAKYESALWLIRGIEQRQKTLRRVLDEIVAVQEGFLDRGPAAFQPLTLKDIALKTGLHESTISRVTTAKYVQTPRGVFELKYFFSSGLKTDAGDDASSMAVKESIREILDDEDLKAPLSDQQIADHLKSKGVHIARRTVAKYREELRILPAHRRKEGR